MFSYWVKTLRFPYKTFLKREKHGKSGPEVSYRLYLDDLGWFWWEIDEISAIFAHLRKNPYLAQTRKSGNLIDFPPKSTEIIEIYSISDFGTLFFVFFTFQRGFVLEKTSFFPMLHHERTSSSLEVTLRSDIRSMFRGRTFKGPFKQMCMKIEG